MADRTSIVDRGAEVEHPGVAKPSGETLDVVRAEMSDGFTEERQAAVPMDHVCKPVL
jgi:hypothetical protein